MVIDLWCYYLSSILNKVVAEERVLGLDHIDIIGMLIIDISNT